MSDNEIVRNRAQFVYLVVFKKSVIIVGVKPSSFAKLLVNFRIALLLGQPSCSLYQFVVASVFPSALLRGR